jgi:hypothetical protein
LYLTRDNELSCPVVTIHLRLKGFQIYTKEDQFLLFEKYRKLRIVRSVLLNVAKKNPVKVKASRSVGKK